MWCPAESEADLAWFCSAAHVRHLRSLQLSLLQFGAPRPPVPSATVQLLHTDSPCPGTGPPTIPVLSGLVWDSALNSFVSVPVQNLRGVKGTDCSKIVWIGLWRSLHQQDILRGSDKQTLLTWPCENLIPKLWRWNAVSHFHCLPGWWMFHDILSLEIGGLKLVFLMVGECTDSASAHMQL